MLGYYKIIAGDECIVAVGGDECMDIGVEVYGCHDYGESEQIGYGVTDELGGAGVFAKELTEQGGFHRCSVWTKGRFI